MSFVVIVAAVVIGNFVFALAKNALIIVLETIFG